MSSQFSLTRTLISEEGVYGLILVSGLIATSGGADATAGRTLILTGVTVVVFWIAHVYAGSVARHGTPSASGEPVGIRAAIGKSVRKSRGLLVSTLPPGVVLLLGAVGIIGDSAAKWIALWVCVAVLATLGFIAYRRKGASMSICLLGALSTASFGFAIIVAKAVVTH